MSFRSTVVGAAMIGAALTATAEADAQRARQGLLSLEDARIFYEVVGTGDPIVVVHGGPGLDHNYLQPGLDALANRNSLVYYDQRGTGRSVAELEDSIINFEKFVDDIEALRQALGFERISILAHSFGSLIGLDYALRYPEQLSTLILMNPVEPGSRYGEQIQERQQRRVTEADSAELAELTQSEGFAARDPATLSQVCRVMFRQTLREPERVSELELDLAANTARNGPDVAAMLGSGLGDLDWWERLAEVEAPTLVLHGRFDTPPQAMSLDIAEAVQSGTFELLDSGHFPYLEDREGLLAAISAFFASLGL